MSPGAVPWYVRDFDCPEYFVIYRCKEAEAQEEGPALAALLGLPPGSLVLDLPSGWGRLRPALEARGYRVFGGDLSPLSLARQAEEFPGPSVRMDVRCLPFRDGCADGVFSAFTSWGYFSSDAENQRQISEYARVLRRGGVLLLDLAGREHLKRAAARVEQSWYDAQGGYRERVRWSLDGRRVVTDRICRGQRFQHDIWIPTDAEVQAALAAAGLDLLQRYGELDGAPWAPHAERWIYRARKP